MKNFKKIFDSILIDKFGVEAKYIIPEAKFTDDLGADSLDMVELIMEFESHFKVPIPDNDVELLSTVGLAENYLKNKLDIG